MGQQMREPRFTIQWALDHRSFFFGVLCLFSNACSVCCVGVVLSLLIMVLELRTFACHHLVNRIRSQALFLTHLMGCGCFFIFSATMMVMSYGSFFLFLDGVFNVMVACFFKSIMQKKKHKLRHILQKIF